MNAIIEWAPIRLAAGRSEKELLDASEAFQRDFLSVQPGFLRRELLRKSEREYVDIVHWQSAADAQAIMDKVANSQACAMYFAVMDMGTGDMTAGVDHFTSLAVYQ
jgi:hypothetical protein